MNPEHVEKLDGFIKDLTHRFGKLPLLVPSEPGMKGSYFKWGVLNRKLIEADDDYAKTYWRTLAGSVHAGGNVCVKLGTDSNNLVTIDIDADEFVEPFVAINPQFGETVVTRGQRGCQFWFYIDGSYPHKKLVIHLNGKSIGEFRGGKSLSNIWGIHPSGARYTMVGDKAIHYRFAEIKLPEGWTLVEAKLPTINWKAYFEMVKEEDGGVVESLVAVYFEGARKTDTGWRCADLTGRMPKASGGSFEISKSGLCKEWDERYPEQPTDIVKVICSEERATESGEEKITVEEVFQTIKDETGEDFFLNEKTQSAIDREFVLSHFAYATCSDEFYFNHGDHWGQVGETRTDLFLSKSVILKDKDDDEYKYLITQECKVRVAVNVAGYSAGIHRNTMGKPFLILETTKFPDLVRGDWSFVNNILHGLLGLQDADLVRLGLKKLGIHQVGLFHCWMKWGMESLRDQTRAPGHYLIIMGPHKCGKSLLQEKIISPLLGCGPSDATPYLTRSAGSSDFNSDLLQYFHWMISDGLAFKNSQERKSYTENCKRVIGNSEQRLHAKYKNAGMVPFCCRISGTLNPTAVESLPLLEEGMMDKLLILQGKSHEYLPNTKTVPLIRTAFEKKISGELPAYAYFLMNEWTIPETIKETSGERLGFNAWINPDITDRAGEMSRGTLLAEISRESYIPEIQYSDTAGRHFDRLSDPKGPVARRFSSLCRNEQSLGHLLNELVEATDNGTPLLQVEVQRRKSSGFRLIDVTVRKDDFLTNATVSNGADPWQTHGAEVVKSKSRITGIVKP
jgi:hypothetical protein